MKKHKIVLGIIAAALSAVLLCGCAGGGTAVGKKYDAIYYAVNDYTIALQKGQTFLFNKDKKVGKKGYYSIERIACREVSAYDEYFLAKESVGGSIKLLKNDGTEYSLGSDIKEVTDVTVNTVYDDNGITAEYATEAFKAVDEDGKKLLLDAQGGTVAEDYVSADDLGNGLWKIVQTDSYGSRVLTVKDITNGQDVFTTVQNRETYEYSNGSFGESAEFADDVTVFTVMVSLSDGGMRTDLYGKNGKIAEGVVDPTNPLYGSDYVIACGGLAAYAKMKAEGDGIEIYKLDSSLNSVKLDYEISGILNQRAISSGTADKAYVKEVNADKKVRVREFGGEAQTEWFDAVTAVAGEQIVRCVSGTANKFFDFGFNELLSIDAEKDGTFITASYTEFANGYSFVARTNQKLYADVSGHKNTYTLADGEDANDSFVGGYLISDNANNTRKLFTAYTNGAATVKYDGKGGYASKFTANGKRYAYISTGLKFADVSSESLVPTSVTLTDEEWAAVRFDARAYNCKVYGDVNISDPIAREEYAAKAAVKITCVNYTLKDKNYTAVLYGCDGLKTKQLLIEDSATVRVRGSYVIISSNGTSAVYEVSGLGEDVTLSEKVKGLSGTAEVGVDSFGNVYIMETVNGRTAVYDKEGTLILEPKYTITDISNGIAVVEQGDRYGIVKLGKKAKNAKLIKKMEYTEYRLMPNGDFILFETGETGTYFNAQGKAVVKNVIGLKSAPCSRSYLLSGLFGDKEKDREYIVYKVILSVADGKDVIVTISIKGKDTAYQRSVLAFL